MRTAVADDFPGLVPAGKSQPAKSNSANPSLAAVLDERTVVGSLWRAEGEDGKIRCVACGHRCLIAEGRRGICKVRFNQDRQLRVPFGYVAALQSDPVEKKPFYHVYPGTRALTFGMLGCDFHCGYCQNWVTSQALRDEASNVPVQPVTPEELVAIGQRLGSRLVVSSYNEPLITAEWAVSVFQKSRAAGLVCAFVSNGNATPEALDYLQPWISAYKVDLKSFDDRRYRTLGGTLDHVIATIQALHQRGIWVEVVTLLVPGFNDDPAEIKAMAQFLASVSRDIPWHITAFHPDYKMTDPANTTPTQLLQAAEFGVEAGLHFVYAGNAHGRVGSWENTHCPGCHKLLIERRGFHVLQNRVAAGNKCPGCGGVIPGVGLARVDELVGK